MSAQRSKPARFSTSRPEQQRLSAWISHHNADRRQRSTARIRRETDLCGQACEALARDFHSDDLLVLGSQQPDPDPPKRNVRTDIADHRHRKHAMVVYRKNPAADTGQCVNKTAVN
eukprot:3362356-Rhodomonas_salina.2